MADTTASTTQMSQSDDTTTGPPVDESHSGDGEPTAPASSDSHSADGQASVIAFSNLKKSFANGEESFTVFEGLDFEITEGSFTSIMGPSGCGKSTLLNVISGLIPPDEGEIRRDGEIVEPGEFFYSYVFQEPRLLDWLTIGENVRFALRAQGVPPEDQSGRIYRYLELVGLEDKIDSYPQQLSGGMRQRVGIARALAVDPEILFMDEPFSSLDEFTAKELRADLLEIWKETGKTIIFVTHNSSEAVFLSDSILILDDNGQLFDQVSVDAPRPRTIGDEALIETESTMMEQFFAHLDTGPDES
ncbi:ABC transporter ATP-binding protein [Halohasta salina]|uniref:ABC transporter ATP-binding protein n=1 Tax=Halohasta salina TaxID=2961621 RepID=UPI0020A32DC8|nr:ABC transporter ATP-binding protein [Halohasta salina]